MVTLTKDYQYLGQQYLGTSGGSLYVRLYAKYSEQDIVNNRTYVYYQARSYYESGTHILDQQGTIAVSGTGADYQSASCTRPTTGESVSVTTSGWVSHNDDGNKNVTGSATINFPNWGWNGNVQATASLPQIPRASEVTCTNKDIGEVVKISVDKKSPSFTSTLTYKIGSLTGTVATKTSEKNVDFPTSPIADSIYAQIPSNTEIQGTIYCDTYSGNTKIGDTKSCKFYLYAIKSECEPSVSATIVDTNASVTAITGSNTKFVRYISKPKVTINATPKKSASIKSYYINMNDGQTSNSSTYTFPTMGSNKINVSATDTRQYPGYNDYLVSMVEYIKLHINEISVSKPEGTSNEAILNVNGAYYNGAFTDTKSNSLSASFKYRLSGATEWTEGGTLTPTITNNTFRINNLTLGTNFDYDQEYQFLFTFEDTFMVVNEYYTLEKGQEPLAVGEDGVYVYGTLFLNDIPIKVSVVDEW